MTKAAPVRTSTWAAIFLALSCQNGSPQSLNGHWRGVELESSSESVTAQRAAWARGTSLHFSGRQLEIQVPGQRPQASQFTIENDVDGELSLTLVGEAGGPQHTTMTLETPSLLRWHIDAQHTVVLNKID